ncbi:MAG: hypothetical protein VYE22_19090 [Myxococcota bacterium]|nr:hypothetical protein [Myxococcota bacterium]
MDPHHEPSIPFGPAQAWATDLALVGAVTGLALGLVTPLGFPVALATAVVAALGGGAVGLVAPRLFHRRVRRKPWMLLTAAASGLGGCWGALAGFVGAVALGEHWLRPTALAATAFAVQLGWLWLPLAVARARGESVHGWVAGAGVVAPLVAWMSWLHYTG